MRGSIRLAAVAARGSGPSRSAALARINLNLIRLIFPLVGRQRRQQIIDAKLGGGGGLPATWPDDGSFRLIRLGLSMRNIGCARRIARPSRSDLHRLTLGLIWTPSPHCDIRHIVRRKNLDHGRRYIIGRGSSAPRQPLLWLHCGDGDRLIHCRYSAWLIRFLRDQGRQIVVRINICNAWWLLRRARQCRHLVLGFGLRRNEGHPAAYFTI